MMGRMNCLYSVVIDSLECPYVVCARALSMFSLDLAGVLMYCVCCLNVAPLSNMSPRILVVSLCFMFLLLSVMTGIVLYSLLYGVMSVVYDLDGSTCILLCVSQCSRVCMYCCMCVVATSCFGSCEMMVRSSA